ncbi:MAG: glycosyltransferase family 1 protein [Bacteroidales bacterium]|jgi:glycosyltransferase involved in cell wall biosynthesis|nr:glycosyltransferase family 1 protein [Bacteroidales bacterium]
MRIGVNTRLFVKGKMDGIAWFSFEVLKRMVKTHPEHEFIFFFDRKYLNEFLFADNVKPVIVFPPARHPILWYLFFEWGIKRILKKEKIDLFLSPDGWICLNTSVKTINIIHDLNFEHYPEFLPPVSRWYYRHFFPRFARNANALITVSNFSKNDIVHTYGISKNKIEVVYNAAAEDFFEISDKEKEILREELTDGIPYFVFVGSGNQRKNITNQLHAFDLFRDQGFLAKLVFAGTQKYWTKQMKIAYASMKYHKDVVFTGYIPTKRLNEIISSSHCLLYASYFEGFGVPILEAFSCNIPVITSNVTAMPETAGDAAILVNPYNAEEITNAMMEIFDNNTLRNELTQKGKHQLKKFSWDNTATQLWQTIEKLS